MTLPTMRDISSSSVCRRWLIEHEPVEANLYLQQFSYTFVLNLMFIAISCEFMFNLMFTLIVRYEMALIVRYEMAFSKYEMAKIPQHTIFLRPRAGPKFRIN